MECWACNSEIVPTFERKPDGKMRCTYTCSCGIAKPKSDTSAEDDIFSPFFGGYSMPPDGCECDLCKPKL